MPKDEVRLHNERHGSEHKQHIEDVQVKDSLMKEEEGKDGRECWDAGWQFNKQQAEKLRIELQ